MKQPGNTVKKVMVSLIAALLVIYAALYFIVLKQVDSNNNVVTGDGVGEVSEKALALHQQAFVADLHADPLLWGRNLTQRMAYGHIELPRLREAGVDLQVFGVVSEVPKTRNYTATRDTFDILPLLFVASLRSPVTWFSPRNRALAQASELRALVSAGELVLVLNQQALSRQGLKGLLALEGMHAMQRGYDDLELFYQAGFRMMGLTHFFDNQVAGSAHGVDKGGLTDLGTELVPAMESLGITIDLAHASPQAFDDVLSVATKPVVVSHGGVKGACPGNRNLSDQQVKAIAQNGGVIGIGYWPGAVCSDNVEGIVRAIMYVVTLVGVDYVGLGSDFDGNLPAPFDVTGLPLITDALLAQGLTSDQVKKVLGGNVLRVLHANLPD